MESTNLHEEEYHQHQHHHHQLQDHHHQLVVEPSDSSLASPCFSLGTHHHHAWRSSPSFLLNNNNIRASCGEEEIEGSNSLTNSMIENMGFAWGNPSNINHDDGNQRSLVIKQESSSNSSSSDHHHSDQMLLLNTLSPNMLQLSPLPHHHGPNKGVTSTNFSQIFPTVNISNISTSSSNIDDDNNSNSNNNLSELISSSSAPLVMAHDLQGSLDVFETARFLNGGSDFNSQEVAPCNSHLLQLFKFEHHNHHHQHHLQHQSSDLKLWNRANNLSSFDNNGVPDLKRHSFIVEPKSTQHHQIVSKKPRFDSRSSCPPFKVRKEKLGDRIAALQQLVAPFGKTDTASVLMEAIGYIKFLQNQVETLSVPYMKLSSRIKPSTNNSQRVSEDGEEHKPDLRSRGLCLVPLSCMTYLASDACTGGVWPAPNFHHGF